MQIHAALRVVAFTTVSLIIIACGGGGGSGSGGAAITVSRCTSVGGDSTQNVDGSANITRSYSVGSPRYELVTTREKADTSEITMAYMVHEPTGTPAGIVVLVAGGGLTAYLSTIDSVTPSYSGGNYLVRSAHRYQANGYRVITIDRPTDVAAGEYGPYNSSVDAYRNSMKHAVDLATIIKRENPEGYNVILSGTSRGAISSAANNTLVAGIAMSSPVTGGSSGTPVGSASLPINRIQRASYIILHSLDGCSVTTPENSRALYSYLDAAGINVTGDEVSGGFRDTFVNNPCGAFDYHGFMGIESCAVEKETSWANALITGFGSNNPPVADSQSVNQGDPITLTATDTDGDTLSFAVPYTNSSLGGSVSTDADGNVSYTPPVGANGAIDTFAFTVTDGNGGVSTGVVSIQL